MRGAEVGGVVGHARRRQSVRLRADECALAEDPSDAPAVARRPRHCRVLRVRAPM